MVGHRSSLAGSLFEACKREKSIRFFFSTAAEDVISWAPKPSFRVRPRDGEPYTVTADILLGADGLKSNIRTQMLVELKADAHVEDTGQAAYRIMLQREQIQHDPELLALLDGNRVTRWIGPRRHIIAYPIAGKQIYNISTAQPDTTFSAAPSATYTTRGSKSAMLTTFADFCPKVRRMLALAPDEGVCEWRLRVHGALPAWTHASAALLGDACHPTLPHLAQGAAQAIEDAAVLAEVLALVPGRDADAIARALRVYEMLRKGRAEMLVEMAAASGRALHLGEGAAREERDRRFAALKAGMGAVPDKWADADVQRQIYGHDCMKVAQDSFQKLYASV